MPYTCVHTMVHTRETRGSACEIKFVVDAALAPRLREWARTHLKADPHGAGPFGDEYDTTSLYFDTADFDVLQRRGSYGRAKYRIRRYNDSDLVFLERKLRKKKMLVKRRTVEHLDALPSLALLTPRKGAPGEWFHNRLLLRKLEPVCQVAYHRTARVVMCDDGLARLTLDASLSATPVDSPQFTPAHGAPLMPDYVVLELKYRVYLPAIFRQLVEEFALEPATISKYRLAMSALGTTVHA